MCSIINCLPLNRLNSQKSSGVKVQRNQEQILFPDEMFEDSIQAYAAQIRTSARSARHSEVFFPGEQITIDRDNFPAENQAINTKWNDTQPFLAQSESLMECISSGKTFCYEYPSDYSLDYVDRVVKREIKSYNRFFSYRHVSAANDRSNSGKDGNIEEKFPSCATKRTSVYPRYARDVDGEWNSIVNTKKYRQAVQFNTCVSQSVRAEDSSQNKIINFGKLFQIILPNDYRAQCVQRYQTYVLLTVAKGRIDKKIFTVPSHCEFEVSRTRH